MWVTVSDVEEPAAAAAFNTAFRVRNLAVIDWSAEVHGRTGLFLDAVHPSMSMVRMLGDLFARQIGAYLADEGLSDLRARRRGVSWYALP